MDANKAYSHLPFPQRRDIVNYHLQLQAAGFPPETADAIADVYAVARQFPNAGDSTAREITLKICRLVVEA